MTLDAIARFRTSSNIRQRNGDQNLLHLAGSSALLNDTVDNETVINYRERKSPLALTLLGRGGGGEAAISRLIIAHGPIRTYVLSCDLETMMAT